MDTSIFLAVAACLLVIFLLKKLSSGGKLAPGPTGLPILGYVPFLTQKPYLDFQRLAVKYGNVFRIKMGSINVVVLNDFNSTKEVFAKDAFVGRPPESPFVLNKETIETGAFLGLEWKEQRRFCLHTLRELGLGKSYMEGHIQEEIRNLLEHLEQNTDKPFRISDLLISSTSNNIGSLVFGKRFEYDDPIRQMMSRVLKDSSAALGQAAWQLFFPAVRRIFRFLGVKNVDKLANIQKELRSYVKKEIEAHEETLDPPKNRSFIDFYLLEIQKRGNEPAFCKPVLQDLVTGFFGAGSETVRLSVEWLLLTAATHQDAQRRIQREIDDVVGQSPLPVYPDHKSMPYTQAFIMELMRWRTMFPINVMRYALEDGEVCGYRIPKHTYIIANMWAIHHDPEYWGEDAEDFRPERFLSEDEQEVKKWERYIPFSIGKRACPGEPLAKVEVFLYFTSILQRFNLRFPDGNVGNFEGQLGLGLLPKPQDLIFTKRK